jgi:serine/threonine protein kinase
VGEPGEGDLIADRYTLLKTLGSGGFGSVWSAHDRGPPEEVVAVKILHVELARNKRVAERFAREAMVLAALDHPFIAKSFDFGTASSIPYIAMELVEGRTLKAEMEEHAKKETRFSDEEVLARMQMIGAAIEHAHDKGVIHRDLKPGNVLIDTRVEPMSLKVLDFGVAKIIAAGGEQTTAGRIVGSLHYMSPEQIRGEELGPRADVFALGALLFEMCTAKRTWARDWEDRPLKAGRIAAKLEPLNNQPAVMQRILTGIRPKITVHREGAPRALDDVLTKALAIDPAQRYASATELVRDLEEALSSVSVITTAKTATVVKTHTLSIPASDTLIDPSRREIAEPEILPSITPVIPSIDEPAYVDEPAFAEDPRTQQVEVPQVFVPAPAPLSPWIIRSGVALAVIAPLGAIAVLLLDMRHEEAPVVQPAAKIEIAAQPLPSVRAAPTEEAVKEPPLAERTVSKTRAKAKVIEPKKIEPKIEPPVASYPELRVLLRSLSERPDDLAIAEELSKKIAKAADGIPDSTRRTSIKRCAAASLFPLDKKELERCFEDLVNATR